MKDTCTICWGSHGCGLDPDHEGQHKCPWDCEASAEDDGVTLEEHMAEHAASDGEVVGVSGCVATWPYYGRRHMTGDGNLQFFRWNEGPGRIYLPEEFARLEALHDEEAKK